MKSHSHNEIPHISQRSSLHHLLIAIAPLFILLSSQCTTLAGSATWAPSSGATAAYWNVASNWSPMIVPNGAADTATFAQNFTRSVFVSADIEVNGITFASSMFPSAYAITANPGVVLRMSGVGVTNNSGVTQNFVTAVNASAAGAIVFSNNATAGASVIFTNNAGTATVAGGATGFLGSSSAGTGNFTNNGGSSSNAGGGVTFFGEPISFSDSTSSGANGTFTNKGATVSGATGGLTAFFNHCDAANATLISNAGLNGGGGGLIDFDAASTGGNARVEVFGNGAVDISNHGAEGVTVGSVEGDGNIFLGANTLTIGSNNKSTLFSGVIHDGSSDGGGGTGGSLTKIGKGKLTLAHANTYTGATGVNGGTLILGNANGYMGGTTVSGGTLLVKNKAGSGSATGPGTVQVDTGTLEGIGIIDGAVTVGTGVGTTSRANLLAGNSATSPGTLTINNPVTFQSDSTYKCVLNRSSRIASKVTAAGVTINNAQFAFAQVGTGTLAVGTVFRVIDNTTSNLAISGQFRNLSNGLVLTSSDGTKFKVNYAGGTGGNDLTLKVVP